MDEEVHVKVEDEMGIFVKEEETFIEAANYNQEFDENNEHDVTNYNEECDEYTNHTEECDENDENASDFEDLLVEPYPELSGKELLVYTRKVDDIWTRTFRVNKNILNKIEHKTKPIFTGRFKKKKKRKYMVKFRRFVQNLQDYNETIARWDKINKSNTRISKVKKKQEVIQTITVGDDSETDSDRPLSTTVHDKDDSITSEIDKDSSNTVVQSIKSESQTKADNHMLVFLSRLSNIEKIPSQLYDIYIINKEGITKEFYRYDYFGLQSFAINHGITIHTGMNNCCWYKRNEKIKNNLPETCINSQAFLRIPHTCEPKQCICCCKKKFINSVTKYRHNNVENEKKQKQNRNYFQNRWHQRLLQRPVYKNKNTDMINSALANTPKRKIETKHSKKNCYLDTHLNLNVGETQKLDYYIDKNGLINTMVKTFDVHDKSYATNDCNKLIGTQHSQYIEQNICCLDKYKKYILKLVKLGESNIAKSIINIAKCIIEISLNRCNNCENVEYQTFASKKSVDISLPKYPKHTINYTHKNVQLNNTTVNKNCALLSKGENINLVKSNTIEKPIPKINSVKPNEKVSNTVASGKNVKTENSIADLQLIIAPNGNVKCRTKCIPETISTENLKILREIIRFASNKIASKNLNLTETITISDFFIETSAKTLLPHNSKTAATAAKSSNEIKIIQTSDISVKSKQPSKNEMLINKLTQPAVPFSKRPSIPQSYVEKPKEKLYQSFTDINAQKRTQYLVSHEFVTNAGTDLWTNVKKIDFRLGKVSRNALTEIYNENENIKRKSVDKGTSPPPKQMRKSESVKDNNIVSAPSTSGVMLRNVLLSQSVQQKPIGESLANVSTLPNNVTVIPIGQLPQNLVQSLYQQYAMLEPQHNKGQIQIPGTVNVTNPASIQILQTPAPITSNVIQIPGPVSNVIQIPCSVNNVIQIPDTVNMTNSASLQLLPTAPITSNVMTNSASLQLLQTSAPITSNVIPMVLPVAGTTIETENVSEVDNDDCILGV